MIDFTNALYLDMRHPRDSLNSWDTLTSGKPAVLEENSGTLTLQKILGNYCGTDVLISSSTLHLAWDIFSIFDKESTILFYDRNAYPILRWGCEFARYKGFEAYAIEHHDPESIHATVMAHSFRFDTKKPVIVCDSFCTGCGTFAPLDIYYNIVNQYNGYVLCDDTQTFGIYGSADATCPWGKKGNGAAAWFNIPRKRFISICSLQKGYGVPLAMVSANSSVIRRYLQTSKSRMHCSSPSSAAIAAGIHAMQLELSHGSALRARLYHRIAYFRNCFTKSGLSLSNTFFPVQTLAVPHSTDIINLHRLLEINSIKALLHHHCTTFHPQISFAITLSAKKRDIEYTASVVRRLLTHYPSQQISNVYSYDNY
jgi:8-amino-7-oxononanoate synthase